MFSLQITLAPIVVDPFLFVLEVIANDKLPEKDRDIIHIACPGHETQDKWKRCLRKVKELYDQAKKYREE